MSDTYLYKSLTPWVHYVPVKSDMSDLVEKVTYVLDKKNEQDVRQIIDAANEWCISHTPNINLAHHMMSALIDYAGLLNASGLEWQEQWGGLKLEKGYNNSILVQDYT